MAAESGGSALSIRPRHLLRDAVENRVMSQFELGGVSSPRPASEAETRLIRIEGIDLSKVKRDKYEPSAQ
jgi:hypothetical protein